mmetsp:Transcript_9758/g.13788  ORF Transcript_9758/g.13788 Transcript_9758/m.13788 type:complete len:119 (+) Transcript_9758:441-797(+)
MTNDSCIRHTHCHRHGQGCRNSRNQNVASENDNEQMISATQPVQEVLLKCDNCHRISINCNNDLYSINFIQRSSDSMVRRRKFKHIIYKATDPITRAQRDHKQPQQYEPSFSGKSYVM